ncbi:MAG: histidine kinase N-terminal 7TM domain-containing protein, partial [Sulfurimicrobium sp.]|nr:histidine kinase N-terminal 7TM domain-containing protein [Sulfurimicrobium sp.]
MSLSTLILALVFIINVGFLLYILFQPKSERQWPIFSMVLLVVLWELTEFLNIVMFSQDRFFLVIGVQSGLLPVLYLAPAFVWLVLTLFGQWKNLKLWKKIIIFLPALLMSPFVFTSYNASNIFISSGQVYYDAGIIYWFFSVYFSTLITYGFYVLCKNRKKA